MDHEGQEGGEEDGMNDANIDETMIVVCSPLPRDNHCMNRRSTGLTLDQESNAPDAGEKQRTGRAAKPNENRVTTPYMTKYERARVLGTRALQIRHVRPHSLLKLMRSVDCVVV